MTTESEKFFNRLHGRPADDPYVGSHASYAARKRDLEEAARRRTHFAQQPPLMFAGSNAEGIGPVGECLCCGHIKKLAVWKPTPIGEVGVCDLCRNAAEPLRGSCSPERGCMCESMAHLVDQRERDLRDRDKRAQIALAREESRG